MGSFGLGKEGSEQPEVQNAEAVSSSFWRQAQE